MHSMIALVSGGRLKSFSTAINEFYIIIYSILNSCTVIGFGGSSPGLSWIFGLEFLTPSELPLHPIMIK